MVLLNLHWLLRKRNEINWRICLLFFFMDDDFSIIIVSKVELTKFVNHFVIIQTILNLVIVQMTLVQDKLFALHQILVKCLVVQLCLMKLYYGLIFPIKLLNVQNWLEPFQITFIDSLFHTGCHKEEFIIHQKTLCVTMFQNFVVTITHFLFFHFSKMTFDVIQSIFLIDVHESLVFLPYFFNFLVLFIEGFFLLLIVEWVLKTILPSTLLVRLHSLKNMVYLFFMWFLFVFDNRFIYIEKTKTFLLIKKVVDALLGSWTCLVKNNVGIRTVLSLIDATFFLKSMKIIILNLIRHF